MQKLEVVDALISCENDCKQGRTNPAMSNRNYLLSQKLCHYLNQGRTLNDLLMKAAQ